MRKFIPIGVTLLAMGTAATAWAQTSVTTATPASLRLTAGGPALTLTLDGQQLAAVTSVRFLQNNQQAGGLTGVLSGPPLMLAGGGGRLTVALSAAQTVPVGTYQLELVAGTQRVATGVSITVLRSLPQRVDETPTVPRSPPQNAGTREVPAPSVTGATPAAVTLRSGGAAQTVVLNGSLLNQVVGAQVQRNGNRVLYGVRAELLPSTDAARREVRLSASGTSGPWGEPLQLVLEYTLGSSPVRAANPMPTPVLITASAPPNVDLIVSSCTVEGNVTRATIRNNGSEGASFQAGKPIVSFKYDPRPAADFKMTGPFTAQGGGFYIAPGGTQDLEVRITFDNGATLTQVTWIVDPNDAVAELNPTNNERTCRGAGTPGVALFTDLGISGISVQPTSGPPPTPFEFTVVVKNMGTSSIPAAIYAVDCVIDGVRFLPQSAFRVPTALAAGATFTQKIRKEGNYIPGSHVFECTADVSSQLTESTRNNNARSL
ncbi:MAG: CARDB domain-containing protein, partial [Longimicrobiales bacterium]